MRHAFTLIELLVVIAIIAILAAILFPVFAQAKAAAKASACLSNMNQLGISAQLYLNDNDDRTYFRASTNIDSSRIHAIVPSDRYDAKWWNMLMPYVKSESVFRCPSDGTPKLQPNASGELTIPMSYVANAAAESLNLSQVDKPASALVLGEKWDIDSEGDVVGETWLEGFGDEGDMNEDPLRPGHMKAFADRHANTMNASFFDGHAKHVRPTEIWGSVWLTGCILVHQYPTLRMCDTSTPGCQRVTDGNICNKWAAANPYPDN
jgi:prepilin-type N-terminal cleavage/methylation domain-containing protein/prepilin-type processing-associated H-X9-DG protein